MRTELWACEEHALIAYLDQLENASTADIEVAAKMFGDEDEEEDEGDRLEEELSAEGVATIRITGPLSAKGPSPIARLFGISGTSYQDITAWFKGCKDRAEVKSVVLTFDSPGGEVSGVDLAWQAIQACGKNCTAENHGMMASAAYWLASACNKINAMSPACLQGSIGVKVVAIDDSEAQKEFGYKRITIISKGSPRKQDDAATAAGREELQKRADAIYGVFLSRVASGRGMSEADVQKNFGEGAVLISAEAKRVGMIDEVRSLMRADAPAVPDQSSRKIASATGTLLAQSVETGRKPMDLKQFLSENPEARADLEKLIVEARAEGVKSIQARVDAAKPFLALKAEKDGYTDAEVKEIAKLAADVVGGAVEASELRGFVRMVDLQKEQRKQAAAEAETKEQGETPPVKLEANAELLARAAKVGIDAVKIAQIEAGCKEAKTDPLQALIGEIQMLEAAAKTKGAASSVKGL